MLDSHDPTRSDCCDDRLASAQCDASGLPRFVITRPAGITAIEWDAISSVERSGGVDAEFRLFLDAQLDAGDTMIDAAPGIGFVALSAATAPCGGVTVVTICDTVDDAGRIGDLGADAGATIVSLIADRDTTSQVLAAHSASVSERLQRIFVHASAAQIPELLPQLDAVLRDGTVAAICWHADSGDASTVAHRSLRERDLLAHWMGEQDGDAALFAASETFALGPIFSINAHAGAADAAAADRALSPDGSARATLATRRAGFNFIAPYCHTGYGIAGANLLRSCLERGSPVAFFPVGGLRLDTVDQPELDAAIVRSGAYDDRAVSVRLMPAGDQRMHIGHGPRVGFPIFELTTFTEAEREQLRALDRILVCTEWARDVMLQNGIASVPIDIVPLGVDRRIFHERLAPAHRDRDTVFLQGGKLEPRKGQRELLRAFEAAFTPRDDVSLVLLCQNPFVTAHEFAERAAPFHRSPMAARITLITTPFAHQRDMARVMAAADCGVFPVRAEGWNLEALEMLSLGKRVIATNYSAHTAFLNDDNARLIAVDMLEDVPAACGVGQWAAFGDVQHEQLVAHLRAIHVERQETGPLTNAAGIDIAERFSWSASADALLHSIEASIR
jgi:glycosyltransferase involved in cell wall biosynthesis